MGRLTPGAFGMLIAEVQQLARAPVNVDACGFCAKVSFFFLTRFVRIEQRSCDVYGLRLSKLNMML